MHCARCGLLNQASATCCARCGTVLPASASLSAPPTFIARVAPANAPAPVARWLSTGDASSGAPKALTARRATLLCGVLLLLGGAYLGVRLPQGGTSPKGTNPTQSPAIAPITPSLQATPSTAVIWMNASAEPVPPQGSGFASPQEEVTALSPSPDSLAQALARNDVDAVNGLLAQGVSANAPNSRGLTALQYVATVPSGLYLGPGAGYHRAVIQALVAHGGDPNLRDAQGNTPLIRAALADCRSNMEDLLSAGAQIEGQSSRGTTALLEATQEGVTGSVEVLLQNHASLGARDKRGRTALRIAQGSGDHITSEVLRRAGARE